MEETVARTCHESRIIQFTITIVGRTHNGIESILTSRLIYSNELSLCLFNQSALIKKIGTSITRKTKFWETYNFNILLCCFFYQRYDSVCIHLRISNLHHWDGR